MPHQQAGIAQTSFGYMHQVSSSTARCPYGTHPLQSAAHLCCVTAHVVLVALLTRHGPPQDARQHMFLRIVCNGLASSRWVWHYTGWDPFVLHPTTCFANTVDGPHKTVSSIPGCRLDWRFASCMPWCAVVWRCRRQVQYARWGTCVLCRVANASGGPQKNLFWHSGWQAGLCVASYQG